MTPERYRIFDTFAEGVQVINPEGEYLYLNEAAAKQARRTIEQLLGASMQKEYPGAQQTELIDNIRFCRSEKKRMVMINEFTFPDKTTGRFMLRMEPIEEGVLIMSVDVSTVATGNYFDK